MDPASLSHQVAMRRLAYVSSGSPDLTWRFPIAFQIIFALVVCIGMIWLPESPRWLLTRERYEEGEVVIAALRGLEIDDRETQIQKAIIMDSIKASGYAGRKGTPLKAVFTGGKTQHFRRMMLGVSSQFMQQVGGCNAVSNDKIPCLAGSKLLCRLCDDYGMDTLSFTPRACEQSEKTDVL